MKFHTEDLQILGANEHHLSVRANLRPEFVHPLSNDPDRTHSSGTVFFVSAGCSVPHIKEQLTTTGHSLSLSYIHLRRLHLKCDGTRAETIFRLSTKRTSPLKSAGASFQSTTGSRGCAYQR